MVVRLALLLVALAAVRAHGQVDMTGRWWVTGVFPTPGIVQFTQSGTSLTVDLPFFSHPGTINPDTGSFSIQDSYLGCLVGLGGVVIPNGRFFSGSGGSFCFGPPSIGSVSGLRCTCFDGNTIDGDGCSADCQVEECWDCVGDPSVCTPTPDGGACTDHKDCTTGETCTAGLCGGGAPIAGCTDMTGPWKVHRTVPEVTVLDLSETAIYDVIQRDGILFIEPPGRLFAGGIDSATGVFATNRAPTSPFCGNEPLNGTVAPDGQTFTGSGVLQLVDEQRPDMCETPTALYAGERTTCSDGVLDPGEACDDGNRISGDGCDPLCGVEFCWTCTGSPSACTPRTGVACDDGNPCTSGDVCTAAGSCLGAFVSDGTACDDPTQCAARTCISGFCQSTGPLVCPPCLACEFDSGCVPAPRTGCLSAEVPKRSKLRLLHGATHDRDRVTWTFKGGDAIDFSALGDPTTSTGWAVCLYDQSGPTPELLFRGVVPAGGTCGATSCWKTKAGKSHRFHARTPNADGMKDLTLTAGIARDTQATLEGQGASLSGRIAGFPTLPLPVPITAQLHGDNGICLSTDIDAPGILRNDAGEFRGRGTP